MEKILRQVPQPSSSDASITSPETAFMPEI